MKQITSDIWLVTQLVLASLIGAFVSLFLWCLWIVVYISVLEFVFQIHHPPLRDVLTNQLLHIFLLGAVVGPIWGWCQWHTDPVNFYPILRANIARRTKTFFVNVWILIQMLIAGVIGAFACSGLYVMITVGLAKIYFKYHPHTHAPVPYANIGVHLILPMFWLGGVVALVVWEVCRQKRLRKTRQHA